MILLQHVNMLLIRYTYTLHNRVVGIKKTHAIESKNGKNRKKRLYNQDVPHSYNTYTVITHIRFSNTNQTGKNNNSQRERKKLSGRVLPFSAKCEYCIFSLLYYIRIVQAAKSKKSMLYIKCVQKIQTTQLPLDYCKKWIFFVMRLLQQKEWQCDINLVESSSSLLLLLYIMVG